MDVPMVLVLHIIRSMLLSNNCSNNPSFLHKLIIDFHWFLLLNTNKTMTPKVNQFQRQDSMEIQFGLYITHYQKYGKLLNILIIVKSIIDWSSIRYWLSKIVDYSTILSSDNLSFDSKYKHIICISSTMMASQMPTSAYFNHRFQVSSMPVHQSFNFEFDYPLLIFMHLNFFEDSQPRSQVVVANHQPENRQVAVIVVALALMMLLMILTLFMLLAQLVPFISMLVSILLLVPFLFEPSIE